MSIVGPEVLIVGEIFDGKTVSADLMPEPRLLSAYFWGGVITSIERAEIELFLQKYPIVRQSYEGMKSRSERRRKRHAIPVNF